MKERAVLLRGVTIDCSNPAALAEFYGHLTGLEVIHSSDDAAGLESDAGVSVWFQRVTEYKRPSWPSQDVPQQFHLDFGSEDLQEDERRALSLGATKASEQPGQDRWRVLLDPEGHPFCLTSN
ncbi:MAG TPA: VOC family protein [Acidimicrobiales bacterium]|nr:VOC family protein [Acidimicrobiales bacterium]